MHFVSRGLECLYHYQEACFVCCQYTYDYAPNFEEVEGTYCFEVVRQSVRPSRFLMHAMSHEPCRLGF